jgi:UDP-N-acetyl-D-mannosaminuronic acid dehydrogenase
MKNTQKNKDKHISIIGLGYVGLTLAVSLADAGYIIHGIESNIKILEQLKNKKSHFHEPGLNNLLRKYVGENLFFYSKLPINVKFYAHIISVGTPLLKGENSPNLAHLISALEALRSNYNGKELVILRSTVSVGVTRNLVYPFLKKLSKSKSSEIKISFCPERTLEGKALEEIRTLPQIISGLNEKSIKLSKDIFRDLTDSIVVVESLEAGELIKLFNNTYRDIQFSIANCFNIIAQSFGIDGYKVIDASNYKYPRSDIKSPGFVGGPCLEKDPYILVNSYENHIQNDEINYIIGARKYNENLVSMVCMWLEKYKNKFSKAPLVITGLAFKGIPETSDLRGSPSIEILKFLKKMNIKVRIHDFCVSPEDLKSINIGEVFVDLKKACLNASGIIILNNHKSYKNVHWHEISYSLKKGAIFFDAWNISEFKEKSRNIEFINLGNFNLERNK